MHPGREALVEIYRKMALLERYAKPLEAAYLDTHAEIEAAVRKTIC